MAIERSKKGGPPKRSVDRRADAHRKIKLGGLIVKADLADEDVAALMGLLTIGKKMLADPERRRSMVRIGSEQLGPDRV